MNLSIDSDLLVVSLLQLWILGCVALPTSGVDHHAAEQCVSKSFLNLCDGQFCRKITKPSDLNLVDLL